MSYVTYKISVLSCLSGQPFLLIQFLVIDMETAPRQPLRELPFLIPRDNIDSGADLDDFNPYDINSTTGDNQLELDFVNNDYCPQDVYTLDIVYEPIFEDSLKVIPHGNILHRIYLWIILILSEILPLTIVKLVQMIH